MGIRKLPKAESPEGKLIIEQVNKGNIDILVERLGYANRETFQKALRLIYGIKVSEIAPQVKIEEPEVVCQPYPDFKIKPFTVISKKRDKEDIVIVTADEHAGKITETYNLDIFKKRSDKLLSKVMRIIELHRPIGNAYVFRLGDTVQGENVYQGSKIGDTACGVWEQVNDYAIPTFSRFDVSLSQGLESVEERGVPGNHGRYAREAPRQTNWDNFVYRGLEVALKNQKHISVNCPTTFYQLVNIRGFKFFLFHGDQVRANAGIPLFALRRKLQEWYAYVGGFHYAYCGHWHSWGADQVNSVADYQICPPLVTGDEWALEVVGRASRPIQLCFGLHPTQGRTWEYKLYTDDDFLPEPMIQ